MIRNLGMNGPKILGVIMIGHELTLIVLNRPSHKFVMSAPSDEANHYCY